MAFSSNLEYDFEQYGFSEEASLEANEWIDHTEWLDFVACMRPDGSVYGTGGKCRSGKEISLQPGEGMPKVAGKARAAGMKQQRVKEIADAVRAKYGGKQVRGEALQSVVRRINESLNKKGEGSEKPKPKKEVKKKPDLDEALKIAEKEARKATSSGAKKGLTEDVGRKFPRKGENMGRHFEDKERDRGRLDAKYLGKLNERQLKRLANEASLNEGQRKRIAAEIEKRGGTAPSAVKPKSGKAPEAEFQKMPGGGYAYRDKDGNALAYLNKGGIGWRAYDANGQMINNYKDLKGAKMAIQNRAARIAKEEAQEDKKLAGSSKEVIKMNEAYRRGVKLGAGAMGEVRRDAGPPPSIVKKGEIGENEAAAMKKLAGTGVAPKLIGSTEIEGAKQVKRGLGGHVAAGQGMLQMSEATGKPLIGQPFPGPQKRIEQLDSLMEARAKMHLAGVAHNDMHRGNVFYDPKTKKTMLVDFGLAQVSPKAALLEALGTNRGGDYQSDAHFQDKAARDNSARYRRFVMNRDRVLRQLKIDQENAGKIRSKESEHPAWLKRMDDARAQKLIEELYKGV